MISAEDHAFLRRAIQIAAEAITNGDAAPQYWSLLTTSPPARVASC